MVLAEDIPRRAEPEHGKLHRIEAKEDSACVAEAIAKLALRADLGGSRAHLGGSRADRGGAAGGAQGGGVGGVAVLKEHLKGVAVAEAQLDT